MFSLFVALFVLYILKFPYIVYVEEMGPKKAQRKHLANLNGKNILGSSARSTSESPGPSLSTPLPSILDNRRQSDQERNKVLRVRDPLKTVSGSSDAAEGLFKDICEEPNMMILVGNVTSPLTFMSPKLPSIFGPCQPTSTQTGNYFVFYYDSMAICF